jgi:cytochrome c biogenesis protein CcmG/thiol:disulfide interchange protein DsbE
MGRRLLLVARGVAVGLVVLLFALLLWKLVVDEGADISGAVARGESPEAPEFTLERLDQEGELSLSDLRGKAVVLNFWASWCYPCRAEAPVLEQIWRDNRERGLVVLGLDAKDFSGDGRGFVRRFGLTFPIVHDGPGDTFSDWGVTALPESYVIGRDGRVIAAFVGAVNSDEDRRRLRAAVARALRT